MTLRIILEPVSSGTQASNKLLHSGDGSFATLPEGPREVLVVASAAQIVGLQGYIILINSGATTTTVETAITALTPT